MAFEEFGKKCYERNVPDCTKLSNKMNKMAAYMVDHECRQQCSGEPFVGEQRDILIMDKAYDMTFGANLMKAQYIITGVSIGIAISAAAIIIYKIIKKKESKETE